MTNLRDNKVGVGEYLLKKMIDVCCVQEVK